MYNQLLYHSFSKDYHSMHNLTEIVETKSKATRSSAQIHVEDDSCNPSIRIGFIHEFSSLIINIISFEVFFIKRFEIKIQNSHLFQTYL